MCKVIAVVFGLLLMACEPGEARIETSCWRECTESEHQTPGQPFMVVGDSGPVFHWYCPVACDDAACEVRMERKVWR
jgi:hypothetical protein